MSVKDVEWVAVLAAVLLVIALILAVTAWLDWINTTENLVILVQTLGLTGIGAAIISTRTQA